MAVSRPSYAPTSPRLLDDSILGTHGVTVRARWVGRCRPRSSPAPTFRPIAAQIRASLGMRQQEAIAAAPQRVQIVLERALERAVRRLDEQVAAALTIADERELLVGGAARPGGIDLAAGDDLDVDLGVSQPLADCAAAVMQFVRAHPRVIGADMRGCRDHAHAGRSGAACQLERRADIGCAVVDAGQDVTVHIDETMVECTMRAAGPRSRCFPITSNANRSCAACSAADRQRPMG